MGCLVKKTNRILVVLVGSFALFALFQNCSPNHSALTSAPSSNKETTGTVSIPVGSKAGLLVGKWRGLVFGNSDPVILSLEFKNDSTYSYKIAGSGLLGNGTGQYNVAADGKISCNNMFTFSGAANYQVLVSHSPLLLDADSATIDLKFLARANEPDRIQSVRFRKTVDTPYFGLMNNDDGDNAFQDPDPLANRLKLQKYMGELAASRVEALQFNVSAGVLYYPTTVGSRYAWKLSEKYPGQVLNCGNADTNYAEFRTACENAYGAQNCTADQIPIWVRTCWGHNNFVANEDPVRIAAEAFIAKSKSLNFSPRFFISYRVSDDHFVDTPHDYPLVTKFYKANESKLTILASGKKSPLPQYPNYVNMLNFQNQAVRDQLVSEVDEALKRYQDISSGIELDFTRTPYMFPENEGSLSKLHITEMVERVQRLIFALEVKNNRPYYLLVRVPPTFKNSLWAGIDIKSWIENRIVDAVIPSQVMFTNAELTIAEFKASALLSGASIYGALVNRQQRNYEFVGSSIFSGGARNPACYSNGGCSPYVAIFPAYMYGAALSLKDQGVAGLQIYNFASPSYTQEPWFQDVLKNISLTGADFTNQVTRTSHEYALMQPTATGWENLHEPQALLPSVLTSNATTQFSIHVATVQSLQSNSPILRLGMYRKNYANRFTVRINGKAIVDNTPVASYMFATLTNNPIGENEFNRALAIQTAPASYLHITVPPDTLIKGKNIIDIAFEEKTTLMDLRIGFLN